MFIFKKSRIIYISCSILLSIIFYSSIGIYLKSDLASSSPIANHTIILDAGHGNPDGGAVSNFSKITEAEINLNIVLKLQKILEGSGCNCILTRSDENGIYSADANTIREKKISDMKNRVNISENSDADIFVSIHMNKLADSKCYGWQTFYKENDEASKKLANSIQENLDILLIPKKKKLTKSISKIYLVKNVKIPLAIIECGFMSNEIEINKLISNEYQDKLAFSIYSGILNYFN